MFTVLLLLNLFVILLASTELPAWHMKPLGSHIAAESVDETFADNLISPKDFAEKYVLPRKPIVLRNVVKTWPAFKLWTDDYLKEKYGDMEMRLEGKKEKGGRTPKGDVCLGRDRLRTFLDTYKKGADKYIVSDLPTSMWHEVHILPSMSCGDFYENFVEIDLWVNSDLGKKGQGGNSVLHKDAFNTVNCLINGTKEWKLIELKYNDYVYQSWEGPMDAGYGGFSLINPEKVDAKKFPNVGKVPRWQFTTIKAGDCIYLPSQMWHQVKSYGETNRAVAFLFSQFNGKSRINTDNCPDKPSPIPLSQVDVDLQYSGSGIMPMGNTEIKHIKELLYELINKTTGYITKRSTFKVVALGHDEAAQNKKMRVEKARELYTYFLGLAGGTPQKMTSEFIKNLTRAQIRPLYKWLFPVEPANSYNYEYSAIIPEDLVRGLEYLQEENNGVISRENFLLAYDEMGGTEQFANDFWNRLAGDANEISDISKTIEHACEMYSYYRREDPDFDIDDDDTITTPQGHKSQPKKMRGGYNTEEEDDQHLKEKKDEL